MPALIAICECLYVAMEDAHATVLELDDKEKNAFFAVYDGHVGEFHPSRNQSSQVSFDDHKRILLRRKKHSKVHGATSPCETRAR